MSTPCWRPALVSSLSAEAPIPLRRCPRPALALGSGSQCPRWLAARWLHPNLPAPPPTSLFRRPLTPPRPPLLAWPRPVPLAPLVAVLSAMSDPGAERLGHTVSPSPLWALSAPAPGPQCHSGTAHPQTGPSAASLLRYLSGARHPRPPLPRAGEVLPRTAFLSLSPALDALPGPGQALPEPILYLLLSELRWVGCGGGWGPFCVLSPPALLCPTPAWHTPTCAGWNPAGHPQGHLSPPWGRQSLSWAGSPASSLPCTLKWLFPPGRAQGAPPASPDLGSPRDDISCANCPLPLSCLSAGGLGRLPSPGLAPETSSLREAGETRPREGKGTHPPGRWLSSPARNCQLHLHRPGLGVGPCLAAPLCPTSRHVL